MPAFRPATGGRSVGVALMAALNVAFQSVTMSARLIEPIVSALAIRASARLLLEAEKPRRFVLLSSNLCIRFLLFCCFVVDFSWSDSTLGRNGGAPSGAVIPPRLSPP